MGVPEGELNWPLNHSHLVNRRDCWPTNKERLRHLYYFDVAPLTNIITCTVPYIIYASLKGTPK